GTKAAFDPKRTLTSLKSRTAAVQIYRPHSTSRRELNDSPHRRAPCRGTPNTTSLSRTRSPAADRGDRMSRRGADRHHAGSSGDAIQVDRAGAAEGDAAAET